MHEFPVDIVAIISGAAGLLGSAGLAWLSAAQKRYITLILKESKRKIELDLASLSNSDVQKLMLLLTEFDKKSSAETSSESGNGNPTQEG